MCLEFEIIAAAVEGNSLVVSIQSQDCKYKYKYYCYYIKTVSFVYNARNVAALAMGFYISRRTKKKG